MSYKKRNVLTGADVFKLLCAAFCFLGFVSVFSCKHKNTAVENEKPKGYADIAVYPLSINLKEGENKKSEILRGSGSYSIQNGDETIAKASLSEKEINIAGVKEGSTAVTVTDTKTNKTAVIQVTVTKKPIVYPNIKVNPDTISLRKGKTRTAEITAGSGFYSVKSGDDTIATASLSGTTITVKGVNEGKTNVTVTDTKSNLSVLIKVTVRAEYGNNPIVFVDVNPPASGIIGKEPAYTLPGLKWFYKGVFVKDRKVVLSPYKIAETEVTYVLWDEVYSWAIENGYVFKNKGNAGADGDEDDLEPVTTISWYDAVVWCNAYTQKKNNNENECCYRKSKTDSTVIKNSSEVEEFANIYCDMTKTGFRLPTEAEWEFAARYQGDGSEESHKVNADEYGSGVWLTKLNSASGADKDYTDKTATGLVAWFSDNSQIRTHNVKGKKPNALKLYDMSGNVNEWCWDWRDDKGITEDDDSYKEGDAVKDPLGALTGSKRVRRGGAYDGAHSNVVVGLCNEKDPDAADVRIGFRLVHR